MLISKFKNDEETRKHAAKAIDELLAKEQGNILFLLSGGSSLKLLDKINTSHFDGRVTVAVTDERYSKNKEVHNFSQVTETEFYEKSLKQKVNFIDTRIYSDESLFDLTDRFEDEIRNWEKNNPDGTIIITQGIGPDGHTIGIMPYPENSELFDEMFNDDNKLLIGYDATKKRSEFPLRITLTLPFLRNHVDHSIVYMIGEDKKSAFEKMTSANGKLNETPARIIGEMKHAKVFTDIN